MTVLRPRPLPDRRRAGPPLPRRDPITDLPLLILYPHSRCNCRCLMCDIWRATTRDEIAVDEIARWLTEWRDLGVRRVVLSGGEPLLHSRRRELCRLLAEAGIGITLLSTGLLLRRDADWLARFCDDVVVSLDGPREVHDRIRRVPRAYDKLAQGVAALRAAGGQPALSARSTVQRENYRYLRQTVAAARELGLDRISFLAADTFSEAFNRPGGWESERRREVALGAEDLEPLRAELAALERDCAAEFAAGFIAESPAKLRRRLDRYFAALAGRGELPPVDCNAPWVSAVIETDGTVRPCFFQPALGNLRRGESLEEILNSPAAIAWRQGLDTRRDAICRRCVCSLRLRQTGAEPAR